MSFVPKKTYSRRNNDLSTLGEVEKENVDPFDELLSSPLKQDVQFQPLSFWGKKTKSLENKKKLKKYKSALYESSDSDDSSPYKRKKKSAFKQSKPKARTLPLKSTINKKNQCFSTTDYSLKNNLSLGSEKIYNETLKSINEIRSYSNTKNSDCNIKNNIKEILNVENHGDSTEQSKSVLYLKPKESKNTSIDKLKFKIFNDVALEPEQFKVLLNENGKFGDSTLNFNESMEETLVPFSKNYDIFKYISTKRYINNFVKIIDDLEWTIDSQECDIKSPSQLENEQNSILNFEGDHLYNTSDYCDQTHYKSENSGTFLEDENNNNEDTKTLVSQDFSEITDDETLIYNCGESLNSTLYCSEVLSPVNCITPMNEKTKWLSVSKFLNGSTILDESFWIHFSGKEFRELIQELLTKQDGNSVADTTADSSLISEENASYITDEESVVRRTPKPSVNITSGSGSNVEKLSPVTSFSKNLLNLTAEMSDLSISNAPATEEGMCETPNEKNSSTTDHKKESFSIDLRNVTTKRKCRMNNFYPTNIFSADEKPASPNINEAKPDSSPGKESVFDHILEDSRIMSNRMSSEWNNTFATPIFESTRVQDTSQNRTVLCQYNRLENMKSVLEESRVGYTLKPGKKWLRSMSVLKQLRNGNISEDSFESPKIKGRKYESFVRDMLEMQSGIDASLIVDKTGFNKSLIKPCRNNSICKCNYSLENRSSAEIPFELSFCDSDPDKTVLEKSLINYTVKIVEPKEKISAEDSHVFDIITKERSSTISAKDFILIQCGQNDVLPFEEHFNERTLKNCKKIGEGVYGEVFMTSDSVIKIIPIEGVEKVNGEYQKTFEEIISEVLIASKLSNLRKGETYRTDGFSEMKRCWCVRGRYPRFLMQLWNEYDQTGSGSENDSPIMFKDDQLYIILELSNGGKDLESFVFKTAAQALSIFIQTVFSLAAAEKAFEFEHRDLHWGNLLISETKDKFATIVLDNVEYKILTKGVKVCIIDFTLSRIHHNGCCIFNDLSADPELFTSEGDYQFEIYRLMLREVKNDWSTFKPKTNIYWLHYLLDKMIKMLRYKNKKAKSHAKFIKQLQIFESEVLRYIDSAHFALSDFMMDVLNKLKFGQLSE